MWIYRYRSINNCKWAEFKRWARRWSNVLLGFGAGSCGVYWSTALINGLMSRNCKTAKKLATVTQSLTSPLSTVISHNHSSLSQSLFYQRNVKKVDLEVLMISDWHVHTGVWPISDSKRSNSTRFRSGSFGLQCECSLRLWRFYQRVDSLMSENSDAAGTSRGTQAGLRGGLGTERWRCERW